MSQRIGLASGHPFDAKSPEISSPLGNAINVAQQACDRLLWDQIPKGEFDEKTWRINPKGHKDLPQFDGRITSYRLWHSRILDHLVGGYQAWGRLLDLVQKYRQPLTFRALNDIRSVDDAPLNLPWLSRHLWTFLGPRLGDSIYQRRVQMAGGEDSNGLELWRRLFIENEGGAEQVALAGLRRFHAFPKCTKKEDLSTFLGDWTHLRNQHGSTIPDSSLYVMLLNMLPEEVAKDVRDKKHVLNTTQLVLDYVWGELARYNDKYLSSIHEKRDHDQLTHGPKNAVNAVAEDKIAHLEQQLETLINVFKKASPPGGGGGAGVVEPPPRPTLQRPDPKFEGCWHCGKKHPGGRRQCRLFKALVQKHGGLPSNNKGEYEKHLERQKKSTVNALQEA